MATAMRLTRTGTTKKPFYRLVVMDSRKASQGGVIEVLGSLRVIGPQGDQAQLNEEKILSWLKKGANPTNTVRTMLAKAGIWGKFKQKS